MTFPLILLAITASAELRQEAAVVVSRRTGVTMAASLELADAAAELLRGQGANVPRSATESSRELSAGGVNDSASCDGASACLVELGARLGAASVVAVETAKVFGELTVRVEVLSVEEHGASWGSAQTEGTPAAIKAQLPAALEPLAAALKKNLVAQPPAVALPALEPGPTSVAPGAALSEAASHSGERWVVGGTAAVLGVTAIVLSAMAAADAGAVNAAASGTGGALTQVEAANRVAAANTKYTVSLVFGVGALVALAGEGALLLWR